MRHELVERYGLLELRRRWRCETARFGRRGRSTGGRLRHLRLVQEADDVPLCVDDGKLPDAVLEERAQRRVQIVASCTKTGGSMRSKAMATSESDGSATSVRKMSALTIPRSLPLVARTGKTSCQPRLAIADMTRAPGGSRLEPHVGAIADDHILHGHVAQNVQDKVPPVRGRSRFVSRCAWYRPRLRRAT